MSNKSDNKELYVKGKPIRASPQTPRISTPIRVTPPTETNKVVRRGKIEETMRVGVQKILHNAELPHNEHEGEFA